MTVSLSGDMPINDQANPRYTTMGDSTRAVDAGGLPRGSGECVGAPSPLPCHRPPISQDFHVPSPSKYLVSRLR